MTELPSESGKSFKESGEKTSLPSTEPPTEPSTVLPPRLPEVANTAPAPVSQSLACGRELFAIICIVVLADLLMYRSTGYAGFGVLVVALLPCLALARPKCSGRAKRFATGVLTLLIAAAAIRCIWLGNVAVATACVVLIVGWTRAVSGMQPFVLDTLTHTLFSPLYGLAGLPDYRYACRTHQQLEDQAGQRASSAARQTGLVLPIIVTFVFGTFFVLANPDLSTWVRTTIESFSTRFADLISFLKPDVLEVMFWGFSAAVAIGFVRPFVRRSMFDEIHRDDELQRHKPFTPATAHTFPSFRNTLVAVTVLFAVYLAFEFATLWRREFPDGFYYAGYAHAGAGWLTVALATASTLLSSMFRGSTLADPRLPTLKKLAWIWSAENFLLAIAVVNRLLIYVEFNGMTRMRTIGFLGVAAVVGGFALVVVKISRQKGFIWLIRGDLFVLALALLTYVLLPVDRLVHSYNVRQILNGHLAPSVQISVHARDVGGDISLIPLLKCNDSLIREGVEALLANRAERIETHDYGHGSSDRLMSRSRSLRTSRKQFEWTSYQAANNEFSRQYSAATNGSSRPPREQREADIVEFNKYVYQWY